VIAFLEVQSKARHGNTRGGNHVKFSTIAIVSGMISGLIAPVEASGMSAKFRWCSKLSQSTTSPSFTITGIPKGTAYLLFKMIDRQSSYNHGGGEIPYAGGSQIPCGAIPSGWTGPFPPDGEVHTYEFTITALDSNRSALAAASATRKFPE
jgi:phosphatidylethanolamine-binding protein (PEBP) family uncharacterized protein